MSALRTMPSGWKNLRPLYLGGLCEAEIWMPPTAPWSRTSRPRVGVATAPTSRTSRPVAVTPARTAGTKTGAETRPSCPTTIGPEPHPAAYAAANSTIIAGSRPSPTTPRNPDTLTIRVPLTIRPRPEPRVRHVSRPSPRLENPGLDGQDLDSREGPGHVGTSGSTTLGEAGADRGITSCESGGGWLGDLLAAQVFEPHAREEIPRPAVVRRGWGLGGRAGCGGSNLVAKHLEERVDLTNSSNVGPMARPLDRGQARGTVEIRSDAPRIALGGSYRRPGDHPNLP